MKLKTPPKNSRFWRYHQKGEGHVSSIEALYLLFKEYEALTGKHAIDPETKNKAALEDLFYLFRLQLYVIKERYETDERKKGRPLPMDEAGKMRLRECHYMQAAQQKKKHRKLPEG